MKKHKKKRKKGKKKRKKKKKKMMMKMQYFGLSITWKAIPILTLLQAHGKAYKCIRLSTRSSYVKQIALDFLAFYCPKSCIHFVHASNMVCRPQMRNSYSHVYNSPTLAGHTYP